MPLKYKIIFFIDDKYYGRFLGIKVLSYFNPPIKWDQLMYNIGIGIY